MSDQGVGLKLLAGAPSYADLQWDEAQLLDSFLPPFDWIVGNQLTATASFLSKDTSASLPQWRSVSLHTSGFPGPSKSPNAIYESFRPYDEPFVSTYAAGKLSFLSTGSFGDGVSEFEQMEFLEQSFAVHEDMKSSQIDATLIGGGSTTSSLTSTASSEAMMSFVSTEAGSVAAAPVLVPAHFTNLIELPKANYIQSIQPQTMTINIIAGIISISEPRTVQIRRFRSGSRIMDIIELLVGDESAAGFSISFWLSPPVLERPEEHQKLRSQLANLRSGDTVSISNIALGVFRGKVHGQSLNQRITKNETKFTVLGREILKGNEATESQLGHKIKRVQDWVLQFVSPDDKHARSRVERKAVNELPPDTQ